MACRALLVALAASATLVAETAGASSPSTYDYIVVGSGPGGGPLAANLARAGYSTLLIEAGTDQADNPTYYEIGNFLEAANDETTRWDFWVKHSDDPARDLKFKHTVWDTGDGTFYVGLDPPAGAKLLGIQYPRAAVLGGCAVHNGGVCSLPADDDWNTIVNKTGDKSWSPENMRKYFKQIEKNEYLPAGNEAHGYNGWLATSTADNSWAKNDSLPEVKLLKKLATLTGQNPDDVANLVNRDILGEGNDDVTSFYSMATHADSSGNRSSPSVYIHATLNDPAKYPLTVKLNTLVTRVLFDNATLKAGSTPRAIGVEIMEGESLYKADPKHVAGTKGPVSQIRANREVIVAGGTFNTPQILKLSGIGPAAELAKFNITVVKDLPGVGENLADNYEGSLLALGQAPVNSGQITLLFRTPSAPTPKRNIYTWCGAFSFEGFWPGFPTDHGPNEWTCAMVHMSPKSHAGSVTLVSADPQDKPDINFRFYENHGDADLHELVEGANILRQAWSAVGAPAAPFAEQHPCPGGTNGTVPANCTDGAAAEYFKLQAYSHHAVGTAAIGGDDDRLAVLDSNFRVRGVQGLRVVDASAWPIVPGAFPSCPTMVLSTKAADVIIAAAKKAS